MEDFNVKDILDATGGSLVKGDPYLSVESISTDTRTIKPGEFFVSLIGERFDGHDFIAQAIEKGTKGIVVSNAEKAMEFIDKPISIILVEDTTKALGDIARLYRSRFNIPVIGITGSNGKTTTKELTAHVLSKRYRVIKTSGNLNNIIGLPLTLFNLSKEDEIAVLEMGISIPGEMSRLTDIAKPDVAIVTNVAPTHLEFLDSVEGVAKEKSILVKSSKSAILNADDPLVMKMADDHLENVVHFSLKGQADVMAKQIRIDDSGRPEFSLVLKDGQSTNVKLQLLGIHNIYNALAAVSAGIMFGVEINDIRSALESYGQISMRMQSISFDRITLINDSYNSNPASVKTAVDLLSNMRSSKRKILVLGDMLELGRESDALHEELGRYIGQKASLIDVLITVGEKAGKLAVSAIKSGMDRTIICNTNDEVVDNLKKILDDGDIILVKGSRGMKMEEIIEKLQNK